MKKNLSNYEFCSRHQTDHIGTWCGGCVVLWRKHSKKLKKVRKAKNMKEVKRALR